MSKYKSWDMGAKLEKKLFRKISPQLSLFLAFLILILFGTFLLMLPVAAQQGHASFIDALFTATSSACVTGLIIVDTAGYWSVFG